jgi:hypothetical protein
MPLIYNIDQALYDTGATWLGDPIFTPTNSGYAPLQPRAP